jgi:SAM-dependent methyltransferase
MHETAIILMKRLLSEYLDKTNKLSVADIGSYNVNGSNKSLFDEYSNCSYTGIDIEKGPGVDIIVDLDYQWDNISSESFDVVCSTHCLEHVEMPWKILIAMDRVLKPGGYMINIAPWKWTEHKYPLDCWRILPEGMMALMSEVSGIYNTRVCAMEERNTYYVGVKH